MNNFDKCNPFTNKNNILYFRNWRISILKEGIIRLEQNNNEFNDYPTQIVINRYFDDIDYKIEHEKNYIKIFIKDYILFFNGNIEESYILYKKQKLLLNNDYNLGGTYSTVDGMDGEKYIFNDDKKSIRDIGIGVCSKNGVAVIDDSNSYCFDQDWKFSFINKDIINVYIFFYPNDYRTAIKDYFEISGYPPKLPKYVFGNWWSRYYCYSAQDYLRLMDNFIDENIPFTVATIDMDWHYSTSIKRDIFDDLKIDKSEFISNGQYICSGWNDNSPLSHGWTGFTWNKELFPDYKSFLNELKKRNLAITLNIHPNDGVAFYEEELYNSLADALNIDTSNKNNIPFDFTNDHNRKAYFDNIFNKYEKDGVDFWWIDWQQGEISNLKGLKPIWLCNHYFYLENMKTNNRPLILSRYCGIGGQRYPLGFSGDSVQSYDSLKYLVKTTPMASNVGFTYWSHDVGGHMMGYKDGEQLLKFVQFATFSPILRMHCSCEDVYDKNPSLFLSGYGELIKKYLRLRHRLIPFIYSYTLISNNQGLALLEPLYYQNSNDENAYKYSESEYYFASSLLVAPYINKADEDKYSKKEVYFPNCTFYDYKYGYKYKPNNILVINREIDDIPVFIKEGAFLLLDHNKIGNDLSNHHIIDVITTYGNGNYEFYEEDNNDKQIITSFENIIKGDKGYIKIKITGDKNLYQKDRIFKFILLNVFNIEYINIDNAEISNIYKGDCLEFDITNIPFNQEIIINYKTQKLNDVSLAKKYVIKRLKYLDDSNLIRNDIFYQINNCDNINQLIKIINESNLKQINKTCLLEVINFAI